jgi:hypothetical protein
MNRISGRLTNEIDLMAAVIAATDQTKAASGFLNIEGPQASATESARQSFNDADTEAMQMNFVHLRLGFVCEVHFSCS